MTRQFEELKASLVHPDPKQHPLSPETWKLGRNRTMLRRTGRLCRAGGRRMRRAIWHSLQKDRTTRTKRVGETIEAELKGGDVQEAYRHLKGWYRAATEVEARPCLQTMERQTTERVALYARRTSPGEPLPINVTPRWRPN